MVVKKDGDWWTGVIGERTGIFPSNYVQEASATETVTPQDSAPYYSAEPPATAPSYSTQSYADDVQNQEEADTEVSEIITQSKSDIQDTYTRPMSTSSQTSVIDQQSIYFLKQTRFNLYFFVWQLQMYRGRKGEVAQVIAPYEATSAEQLTLQRGQYIMIRKKSDTGWWEGELQVRGKRRQIGWFPATYVKVKESGRLSGRSTPVSGGKIQMHETILGKQ